MIAPPGAAEEFLAAIEAATGEEIKPFFNDPMDPPIIRQAFAKLLLCTRPDRGLDVLMRSGVLQVLLPELTALVGFGEGIRHKDVWIHTKKVIVRTPPKLEIRWAAMLHDIGKVPTRRFDESGQVTFWGHAEVGAKMFDKIASRLNFAQPEREKVRFLIASHLRASAYNESWTDSAVRRFARESGELLEDLLDLSRADITSKHLDKVERGIREIDRLALRVAKLKELDAKPNPLPKGLGGEIIRVFGIQPGPKLGELMRRLAREVEAGHLGVQETYSHYISFLEQNRSILGNDDEDMRRES